MNPAPGPLFEGLRFAHAVSLGANCEPAHQLRRLGRHSLHGPFDWLVTPLGAVEAILADDGARLATSFLAANAGTSVRCGAYGVLYHHEFPREGAEGAVRFDADLVARCRRKLLHKLGALFDACAAPGPLLFIRMGPESDLAWDDAAAAGDTAARGLEQAIARRFPALDFRLLVIDAAPQRRLAQPPPGDRLEVVHAPRRRGEGWALDDGDWDAIFARLRFAAPADAGGPLDETLYVSGETVDDAVPPSPVVARASPDTALHAALGLWRDGRAREAAERLGDLFARGCRTDAFLQAHAALLTGEARFAEVVELSDQLVREGVAPSPRLELHVHHARLALSQDRPSVLSAAAARESRPGWLKPDALMAVLETACRARRPFAFVRIGDGEARFALATGLADARGLGPRDTAMMGEVVWRNWFGTRFADADPAALDRLVRTYRDAVARADVLGVADAARLSRDTGHFGYLAAQEDWLARRLHVPRRGQALTSALNHFALEAASPHLRRVLEGLPFVGAVSPYPDLAARLAAALAIPRHADHAVPAEGRLPTAEESRRGAPHFPQRYEALLRDLHVPFRGAVFVVAAGLLGKVYCRRIKALGGVALDIGAVADGWMGFDTRPGQTAEVASLPPLARAAVAPAPRVVACISMHKTGSTALTEALREGGAGDVLQLHSTAPPREVLENDPSPTAFAVLNLIRTRPAVIVTCVRDPIAQILSAYFQVAMQRRHLELPELALEPDALIAWADRIGVFEHMGSWMDANLRGAFGFDYRRTPFSSETSSLRHEAGDLRLLVLRFEDPAASKQRELGWLIGKPSVALPLRNVTSDKSVGRRYLDLQARFTAPDRWLKLAYGMEMVRHFYSETERETFRRRWSAPAAAARSQGPLTRHSVAKHFFGRW